MTLAQIPKSIQPREQKTREMKLFTFSCYEEDVQLIHDYYKYCHEFGTEKHKEKLEAIILNELFATLNRKSKFKAWRKEKTAGHKPAAQTAQTTTEKPAEKETKK